MDTVFFEVDDTEAKILLDLYGDIDYDTTAAALNAANASRYADARVISCFVYSDLCAEVLARLPRLKFIATRSRTFDHIDLGYCSAHGIAVANVPDYGCDSVAEHVFSLLLSLSRHIPQAAQKSREGNFSPFGLQGFDLRGKTMGIVGTGAIGMRTARIARAFGMEVIGCDIRPNHSVAAEYGFIYSDLEDLLGQSDIISLHVSGAAAAGPLLSDREFRIMKDGVTIINTSVGSAIDIKALLAALSSGKVGAVGLDVLPDETAIHEEAEFLRVSFSEKHDAETLLASHALLHHKNVIVTPHIAFCTKETVESILRTTGDNIHAFRSGHPLNVVNAPPAQALRAAAGAYVPNAP
ncbi:MAG: hydroxyacid dehydrogenase [Alphaproteobacteria bacterium]|nr:hydroxyacid dehydrogenase [Alphaproteobacteria bacterium]MDE2336933.1 hydroxyacid dehydrogenase [Alphaproteobacteria bacterium]